MSEPRPIDVRFLARQNLSLLIVFDVLAEVRSVSIAAGRLSRSQPAISHALGKLRRMVGDELFLRGPNGLRLTPRAEAIRLPVRRLLTRASSLFVTPASPPSRREPAPVQLPAPREEAARL